jgi:hypothetical protein
MSMPSRSSLEPGTSCVPLMAVQREPLRVVLDWPAKLTR